MDPVPFMPSPYRPRPKLFQVSGHDPARPLRPGRRERLTSQPGHCDRPYCLIGLDHDAPTGIVEVRAIQTTHPGRRPGGDGSICCPPLRAVCSAMISRKRY
jgi:hypothetical protein